MLTQNTKYSLKLALLSLGLFMFFRLVTLFIAFKDPLSLPVAEVLQAFFIGLRYDINVLMYVLVPVIVAAHVPWFGAEDSKLTRRTISTIMVIVLSLCSFSLLLDVENMRTMGTRFYIADLSYLNDLQDSFEVMVSGFNLPLYVFMWLLITGALAWLVHRATRAVTERKSSPSVPAKVLGPLVLILIILAAGLYGFTTLRWGNAYFSRHQKLNELALNGPYVLYYSYCHIKKQQTQGVNALGKGSREQGIHKVRELTASKAFGFLDNGDSIVRELSGDTSFKPYNIVVIIMESFSANYIGALGASRSLTPDFDRLAEGGLLFTNFYANGTRTNMGLPALLMSYPDYLPGESFMRSIAYRHKQFSSIADMLKDKGYETYYVTGGRIGFDNQEGFMRKHGFDRLVGFTDFNIFTESEKKGLTWTVPDEVIFDHAHKTFTEYARNGRRFLGVVLTLSNHSPFMLPEHYTESAPDIPKEQLAFMYSDWALGRFMEKAGNSEYFRNTVFVITADTGLPDDFLEPEVYRRFHIPLLIYAPGLVSPGRSAVLGSQLDLMPTLMELIGVKAPFEGFGKSLISETDTRFLISKDRLTFHIIRDGLYIKTDFMNDTPRVFPLGNDAAGPVSTDSSLVKRILNDSRIFVRTSIELLKDKN